MRDDRQPPSGAPSVVGSSDPAVLPWAEDLAESVAAVGPDELGWAGGERVVCMRPFEWFEVGNQPKLGDVFLCCPTWLPKVVGNLLEQSVEEVWNGEAAQEIRRSILDGTFRYCDAGRCPYLRTVTGPVQRIGALPNDALGRALEQGLARLPYGPRVINCCYDRSCNLACPSCRMSVIIERNRKLEILELQEKITSQALAEAKVLYITGSGDPFGSPFFRDWLHSMKRSDAPSLRRIHLHTNAQMWTPHVWEGIDEDVRALITSAEISIDAATPETYAINRSPGRFDRLLKNLEFVRALRASGPLRYLAVHMVVQENNFEEMPAFVELGRTVSADRVIFSQLTNWGTFTDDEFRGRTVHRPEHSRHTEFRALLRSPRFDRPSVFLGNLAGCRPPPVAVREVTPPADRPATRPASGTDVGAEGRPAVQSLWLGARLPALQVLALRSFVAHGHPVHLYAFDPIENVPAGVTVMDAAAILPRDAVFAYRRGFGKGSVSAFSNMFRYALLLERGGWWVDTDVVCLRPFEHNAEFVFATERHPDGEVTTASCVIRSPAGAAYLEYCLEVCRTRDPDSIEWGEIGPRLMHAATEHFDLAGFRMEPEVFNPIDYAAAADIISPAFDPSRLSAANAVHLWNQKWVAQDLDPDYAPPGSLYASLRQRYGMEAPGTIDAHEAMARHMEFQRGRLTELRAERDELDATLDANRDALAHANDALAHAADELAALRADLDEVRRELEQAREETRSTQRQLAAVLEEFAGYRSEAEHHRHFLEAEVFAATEQLARLQDTASWKVTAPLRAVFDGLVRLGRRVRGRD